VGSPPDGSTSESSGIDGKHLLRRAAGRTAPIGAFYLLIAIAGFVHGEVTGVDRWPLQHDQVGYYAYLPGLFIDGNLAFESFDTFARNEVTGRRINPYPPGVALLQAPFFLTGHLVAVVSGAPRDGFSAPYRFMACLGGAFYAWLGLVLLFGVLRRRFTESVTFTVVVAISLGSNLLYYGTIEPLMSHAYSFAAFAGVLWSTFAWWDSGRLRHALGIGAGLGLIVLIRATNGVFALIPIALFLTYPSPTGASWRTRRARHHAGRHVLAACAAGIGVAVLLPAYWHYVSGEWLYNPHGPGTFFPLEPAVGAVLFSYRKGWFVYAPIMLATIPGLVLLRRVMPGVTLPLLLYTLVNLYVVSIWWNWWYGGGFGMRALIESTAPLALALAAVVAAIASTPRRTLALRVSVALFVSLNVFQTYQYVMTYIRWDGMTQQTYWAVFGRPVISGEELAEIMQNADIEFPRVPRSGDGS